MNAHHRLCLVAVATLLVSFGCQGKENAESSSDEAAEVAGPAAETPREADSPAQEDPPAAAPDASLESTLAVAATAGSDPVDPVYDLFDNRFLSHGIGPGGHALAWLGGPYGGKYIRGAIGPEWRIKEAIDEVPVATPLAKRARLFLPLTEEQAKTGRVLSLRVNITFPNQTVGVGVNGTALTDKTGLSTGWTTLHYEVPEGVLVAGENEVGLRVAGLGRVGEIKTGLGLMNLSIGATEPAAAVIEGGGPTLAESKSALSLSAGEGLGWYVYVPKGSSLQASLSSGGETCGVEVRAHNGAGVEVSGLLKQPTEDIPTLRQALPLDPLADTVARLTLTSTASCAGVELVDPAIVVAGAEPTFDDAAPRPKHVVIWLIDTLRADHLPFFNPETDVQTPNLAKFVEESVLFENTYSDGNESKVSHASLFTGLYPIRHRHYRSSTKVRDSDELIPEAMRRAGLTTAGFISNGYISEGWGFKQGWDRWVNTIREGRTVNAQALVGHARRWLDDAHENPFFIYFGTIDPHVHYFRHEEFIDLYDPNDAENMKTGKPFVWKVSGNQLHDVAAGRLKVTDADKARMHALYKNEITYNDKHFGKMLELLESHGVRDDTMIIVVADHGEEFFEHGGVGHARTLYEHTVHVPLIVNYPPRYPKGKRVSEGADLVDIYASIVGALGVDPPPEGLQGRDLAPLANGVNAGYPTPTRATMGSRKYVFRMANKKLHLARSGDSKLYDVKADWLQKDDLAKKPEHALTLRWMHDAAGTFVAYRSDWSKETMGEASNLGPDFDTALGAEAR